MKKISLIIALISSAAVAFSQISGYPATPPAPQSAPAATAGERSAAVKRDGIVTPSTPVPPIYPGAEPVPVVMPRDLVYPSAPPSPTQPQRTEPLTPIESTNQLQPTRPQRDEASRENGVNGRPASRIPDNRINKNEARAATTVENTQQVRNNVVLPARKDSVRPAIADPVPAKRKSVAKPVRKN